MRLFGRNNPKKGLIDSKGFSMQEMFSEELQSHEIRKLEPSEIKRILEISQKSLSERYSKELMLEIYQSWPDGFLVYATHNGIYGFLAGRKMSQREARILMLATDEKYRSLGIGGEIIEKFILTCQIYGIITVRLEVRTDNKRGIEFYQKHGFMVTSILRNYYSDGSDAYVMWKQLI
ncbi:MAG: GNAT family N-acetyltransferase [Cuniculiplasma sp.]